MINVILCDSTSNDIQLSKELLHSCPSINIVATSCSSTELLNLLQNKLDADVIILDIALPFTNSLTLIKDITMYHPNYKVLIHSLIDNFEIIVQSLGPDAHKGSSISLFYYTAISLQCLS